MRGGIVSRRGMLGRAAAVTVGLGALTVARSPEASATQTLASDPYPPPSAPLAQAEQLISYLRLAACPTANNTYKDPTEPNIVVWGDPADPGTWFLQAQCASFMTAVLTRTFAWATGDYFLGQFGTVSPFARDYQRVLAAATAAHLQPVTDVRALQSGDLIAIDYVNGQSTNTGHVVMVRRVKAPYTAQSSTLNFADEVQYPVEVVDCTSDPHGVYGVGDYFAFPDTRMVDGVNDNHGGGYGHMMFYASATTGAFTRYRWSVNTGSSGTHTVAQRPIAAGRPVA